MRSRVNWWFISNFNWLILKCLWESEIVHWHKILYTISGMVPPLMSRSWVGNVEQFLVMRVLLNVKVIIMIDMIIWVVHKTIRIVIIVTFIWVIWNPVVMVTWRMMIVMIVRWMMIMRMMLVVMLVFMLSHRLELKFRLGQLWTLVIGHYRDLVTIVQIKLRMMVSVWEHIKVVKGPVGFRMVRELVKLSLTVVMCSILLCFIIGWMICHFEWMLTI